MAASERVVRFVDLGLQHGSIRDALDEAVQRVLDSNWFILGGEVERFEDEFAAYCGVEHCIGVGSGTDALILALRACGIEAGDEVITPSHTFFAGPLAIATIGAVPVFVDVDDETGSMSVERVAAAITSRTRAILPVHLYGACVDLDGVCALAKERGLVVIEDAAQAHGARRNGIAAGARADCGCFSFYPSKNLGACGDAGAIVTDDPKLAQRLRLLRNYGQTEKYHHDTFGTNSRLDEIQAAILRAKLPHLDGWNEDRRRAAGLYAAMLEPSLRPPLPAGDNHVFHLYVIRTGQRDALQRFLAEQGVETGVHYPVPVHRQRAFQWLPHVADDLRVTDVIAAEVLSLPMFPTISDDEIRYVADRTNAGVKEVGALPPGRPR